MMRRIKKLLIIWLVCSGVVFWGILAIRLFDVVMFRGAIPPGNVKTINDFLAWHPIPSEVLRVTIRGATYYMLIGDFARTLPSSRAAYTFDEKGNFVEWTSDCGDFRKPPVVFSDGAKRETMSIEQLLNITKVEPVL